MRWGAEQAKPLEYRLRGSASSGKQAGVRSMKLSVIIPVYNEAATLAILVDAVLEVDVDKEIVLVEDGSSDESAAIVAELAAAHSEITGLYHGRNRGKGAAIRTGVRHATGDLVIIQDADLEYSPEEYPRLMAPILDGRADVVYGSRFTGGESRAVIRFRHYLGNKVLTFLSNIATNLWLSDMETCYKVFRREIIQSIPIEENRFGFEPEITAKLARRDVRIWEIGITYRGRAFHEGKKIGWRDGVRALWCIVKYNVLRREELETRKRSAHEVALAEHRGEAEA